MLAHAVLQVHFTKHSCYWHTKFVEVRHPLNQMQAREVLQVHLWSTVVTGIPI
jgi:hypothetical protein